MIVLPLPMVAALVLGFLFLRAIAFGNTPRLLAAVLLACACQSVMVSLVQYYGLTELRLLPPVTASVIPALAWVAFVDSGIRVQRRARDWAHILAPILMTATVIMLPALIDTLLVAIFVGYAAAILIVLRRQDDDLANTRLASGHIPALIWRFIALALIASAISDVLISLALAYGYRGAPGLILSMFSSLALLMIGFMSLSPDIAAEPIGENENTSPQQNRSVAKIQDDVPVAQIMEQLEMLLTREKLYLDPDLTLSRLARRLGYPLKQVSTAINQATGENVSRFINQRRIVHACQLLEAGQNVTTAMLESGFNTKSNFNREFLRITGINPGKWKSHAATAPETAG